MNHLSACRPRGRWAGSNGRWWNLPGIFSAIFLGVACSDSTAPRGADSASAKSALPTLETNGTASLEMLRKRAADPGASAADKARYGDALLEASGYRDPDLQEAVRWLTQAAAAGAAEAQYKMGLLCEAGQGVARDLTNAFEWFRKAASQDHADAQYSLALAYATGSGTPKDREQSVRWFREAALQGVAESAFNLAQRYQAGQGIAQDVTEAAAWFQVSRDGGFAAAARELARVTAALKPDQLASLPSRVAVLKELCRQKQSQVARRASLGK